MDLYARSVTKLIDELTKLPGIGARSAQRIAFHILKMPEKNALSLTEAISYARANTKMCSVCCNLTETDPCRICSSPKRDRTVICVVQEPKDVAAIERTMEYNGQYHVLNGVLSPMNGVSPENINIKELLVRMGNGEVSEVILATNPTIEGETTASYIARILKPFNIKVTRIAHGIPIGGDLEYADEVTLAKAIEGRHEM